MEQLVGSLINAGPYGIALAAILMVGGGCHKLLIGKERERLEELRARLDESKSDKAQAQAIIVGNTEAMTKLCGAVDNGTETNRQVMAMVQRVLERG